MSNISNSEFQLFFESESQTASGGSSYDITPLSDNLAAIQKNAIVVSSEIYVSDTLELKPIIF